MIKFSALLSTAAAASLIASAATAATVLIDDFSVTQEVRDLPSGGFPNTSTETIPVDVLRTFTVDTDPDIEAGSVLKTQGNQLKLENSLTTGGTPTLPIGQFAFATVTYDYTNTAGGSIDLVDGTNTKFSFNGVFGDLLDTTFTTTVASGTGSDTVVEILDLAFSKFTSFSAFNNVDFTDVTSIKFEFDTSTGSPAFDASVSSITAVPLPASAFLLLGGLGGFAGLSAANRRRRRKEV